MRDKNALPPEPTIAALNAVESGEQFMEIVRKVARCTFTAGHDAIAAAIHVADNRLLAEHRQRHWIDPQLQDQALDNLSNQMWGQESD